MADYNEIINDLIELLHKIDVFKTRAEKYYSECADNMELGEIYAYKQSGKLVSELLEKYKSANISINDYTITKLAKTKTMQEIIDTIGSEVCPSVYGLVDFNQYQCDEYNCETCWECALRDSGI